MGLDVYSRIVIGFRVEEQFQKVENKLRGCGHPLATPEQNFCSECGAKSWHINKYNALNEPEFIDEADIFQSNNDEEAYYVGLVRKGRFTEAELKKLDFDAIRSKYRDLLIQEGIDIANCEFGLHLAVYWSY